MPESGKVGSVKKNEKKRKLFVTFSEEKNASVDAAFVILLFQVFPSLKLRLLVDGCVMSD